MAKGREVRWDTALQPQGEAVWLRARGLGDSVSAQPPNSKVFT